MTVLPRGAAGAPAMPAAACELLAERGLDASDFAPSQKLGLRRPLLRFVASDLVLEVALDDAGRARIRRELWGRAWATRAGLPTAEVHGAGRDGEWLLAEWVPTEPATGERYLHRAVEVAVAIAAADPPPAAPGGSVWRSPRRAAVVRTARAVAGRMPLRLWWAARSAAQGLPRVAVGHNDYYHRNVLWRPDRDDVCVVDWEYLGAGPRYGDLLRMWTVLPHRRDRDELLSRLFAIAPTEQHQEIAALALWLSLRLLGENIKSPRAERNDSDLAHAWALQPEARALAREYGAWPL